MKKVDISLPENVRAVIRTLRNAGYEAYIVGGCVRDAIMGREPGDWDITTSAEPLQVKKLFRRTVDTGIQHGTVTVLVKNDSYEVTTYRADGEYKDGRHPENVEFVRDLVEDLKRRDLTINAMAYDENEGLIDLFGGMEDMESRIIRCVGEAGERFHEDALRIIRALRFSAQLGFEIEENTFAAMKEMAGDLEKISAERIQTELTKLMISPHPEYIRRGWEAGITKVVLPELDAAMAMPQNHPHHIYSVGEHIIHSLTEVEPDRVLRLTMLLHDIAKPLCHTLEEDGYDHFHGHVEKSAEMAETILRRLKYDNKTVSDVCTLVRYHDRYIQEDEKSVRRLLRNIGPELAQSYIKVKRADIRAQSMYMRREKEENLDNVERLLRQVIESNDCYSIKDLAVNGRDVMAAGVDSGPAVGEILDRLLNAVIEDPRLNERDTLLGMISTIV